MSGVSQKGKHAELWLGNVKDRHQPKHLDVKETIILKRTLKVPGESV